jgi:hypothetical protein
MIPSKSKKKIQLYQEKTPARFDAPNCTPFSPENQKPPIPSGKLT